MKINLRIGQKWKRNAEGNRMESGNRRIVNQTVASAIGGGRNSGRRRGGTVCRTALAVGTAGLLSLCAVASPLALGIRAYAADNPAGVQIDDNTSNIDKNKGVIVTNNGTVNENCKGDGFSPPGSSHTNGYIQENQKLVNTNYGTVNYNMLGGTVQYNGSGGEIFTNKGTIQFNKFDGTVLSNWGTIQFNESGGTVETNWGTIQANHGEVLNNEPVGTIKNNDGSVNWNFGIVENHTGGTVNQNGTGGKVYNYGGTVTNGGGEHYFRVDITVTNATTAYGDGYSSYNGQNNWLEQKSTGTVTITPAPGYEITNIQTGGNITNAKKNADGSWTLTVDGSKLTGNVVQDLSGSVVEVKPEPQPQQEEQQEEQQPQRWTIPIAFLFGGEASSPSAPQPAANTVEETKENFDSVYYADNNPDVFEVYGYDHDLLWNHYVTYGRQEGRKVRFVEGIHKETDKSGGSEASDGKDNFNAIAYADYYADVREQYGYDGEALWAHYDIFGRSEGRHYFAK